MTSDSSSTTTKLDYGFHLHDGPWYACRDVTRLPSTGDNQSDLNYDYAYDWFEYKRQPEVSSATSTKSFEAKESAAGLYQNESECRKINCTETGGSYEDVEDWGEPQRSPIKSQKQKASSSQSDSDVFSRELSRTQNAFEPCETKMPQMNSKTTISTTKQIRGACSKTRDERKPDPRKTKHRIQEKKSEKSSTPNKMPENYTEIAEKVIKQIEKSSESRNEDFEDFDLIQLYLAAKESLKN